MTRRRLPSNRELATICLLILFIAWLSVLLAGIFRKEQVAQHTVNDTRAELNTLDARAAALSTTVHDLQTSRGQEESVRETYGVAKPGEDVIIVVPKKDALPPPPSSFWDKVKAFLGI